MPETVTIQHMGKERSVSREEALALIERAHEEVHSVCKGSRREGGRSWTMCIPVEETDSDMVIGAALSAAEAFLKSGPPAATEREPLPSPACNVVCGSCGAPCKGLPGFFVHYFDHRPGCAFSPATAEREPLPMEPSAAAIRAAMGSEACEEATTVRNHRVWWQCSVCVRNLLRAAYAAEYAAERAPVAQPPEEGK